MRRMVEKILKSYGRPVILVRQSGETTLFACLQPVVGTSNQDAQRDFGPLGERSTGKYTYIGPAEPEAQVGDLLRSEGNSIGCGIQSSSGIRAGRCIAGAFAWRKDVRLNE